MASLSKTVIANMALAHVGAGHTIEDIETEVSAGAEACRVWYDHARRQVLEAMDWGFADTRISGTAHSDTISETSGQPYTGTWGFRYVYPAKCITMRKIQAPNSPPGDAIPFAIALNLAGTEKTVLTNEESAVLVFTLDQEVTDLFSPGFVMALSLLLAHFIAFTLTGKRSITRDLLQKYTATLAQAGAMDANEGVSEPPRDGEAVRARA